MVEMLNAADSLITPLRLGLSSATELPVDSESADEIVKQIERILFAEKSKKGTKHTNNSQSERMTNRFDSEHQSDEEMEEERVENEAPSFDFGSTEDSEVDELMSQPPSDGENEEEHIEQARMDSEEYPEGTYDEEEDESVTDEEEQHVAEQIAQFGRPQLATRSAPFPPDTPWSDHRRPKNGEPNARISFVFSVLIASIDDLRIESVRPEGQPNGELKKWPRIDDPVELFNRFSELMEERMKATTEWFERLMDRTEARVRFALALNPRELSKKKKMEEKGGLNILAHCLDLMREGTNEAAGHPPAFDPKVLRPLCSLADCLLRQIEVEEKLGEKKMGEQDCLRAFFRRSSSISDPLERSDRNRNAFRLAAEETLPLARRSALLIADATPSDLFRVAEEQQTIEEHLKWEHKRGIKHPHQIGWSDPPARLDLQNEEEMEKEANEKEDDRTDVEVIAGLEAEERSLVEACFRQWSGALRLLSSMFEEEMLEEVGGELLQSPLLSRFASFPLKQKVFSRRMALHTNQQNENLEFPPMPRDPHQLLGLVFDHLHDWYARRAVGTCDGRISAPTSAFASKKVFVSFRDEPGQGSGVFRSFLVAFAEAVQQMEFLPKDREGGRPQQPTAPPRSPEDPAEQWDQNFQLRQLPNGRLEFVFQGRASSRKEANNQIRFVFARNPPRYVPLTGEEASGGAAEMPTRADLKQRRMGEKFFVCVRAYHPDYALQITGFLTNGGLSSSQKLQLLMSPELLRDCARALADYLRQNGEPDFSVRREFGPLFRRSPSGFLSPVWGMDSTTRRLAFRHVGRMMGIALQHGELLPLPLGRHVLKFVLKRPIGWFDLAFDDPDLFDQLRKITWNVEEDRPHSSAFFEQLELSFVADEESGGQVELEPNGEERAVDESNVLEYVRLLVERRFEGSNRPALEAIRSGVEDVLPLDSLAHLTPEDLRLLLCGPERVNTRLLRSMCDFVDESRCSPTRLSEYKEWVFDVIEKLDERQKQDLLFFWTGTPALPLALNPPPTVLIRPADDRLPTANTCISRLSIPLYDSKRTLREKLVMAIQHREFGFI